MCNVWMSPRLMKFWYCTYLISCLYIVVDVYLILQLELFCTAIWNSVILIFCDIYSTVIHFLVYWWACCIMISHTRPYKYHALRGLRGCKNRPAPFPDQMPYKGTKPGLVSVLYLSRRYTVLLFIMAHFYVLLVFVAMCSIFWLFWLSYRYLPSDWLERLLWGSLIMTRDYLQKAQAEECMWFSWFIVLLHCFTLYFLLSPAHTWYILFSYFYGAI